MIVLIFMKVNARHHSRFYPFFWSIQKKIKLGKKSLLLSSSCALNEQGYSNWINLFNITLSVNRSWNALVFQVESKLLFIKSVLTSLTRAHVKCFFFLLVHVRGSGSYGYFFFIGIGIGIDFYSWHSSGK